MHGILPDSSLLLSKKQLHALRGGGQKTAPLLVIYPIDSFPLCE